MAWYPPGGDSLPPLYWGRESAALTEAPWLQAGASDLPGLSFLLPQVCHSEITRPNVPNSGIRDQIRGLEDGQQGSALASAAGVSAGQMCLSLNTLGREGSKCTSCRSRLVNKKR